MTPDGASMYSSSLLTTATSAAQQQSTAETTPPIASPPSVTTATQPPVVSTVTPTSAALPPVSAAAVAASAAAAAAAASQVQVAPAPADPKVQPVAPTTHAPPPQMAPMAAAAAFGGYTQGMVFATPDPATTGMEEQPTFVNPKQYARILKRRESRKKQTGTDVTSYTPRKRSYMHESRHKHAMQRRRGPGGRFLSKEEREAMNGKETAAAGQ